jgi:hypothetical protein
VRREEAVASGKALLIALAALLPLLAAPFVLAWASSTGRLDRWQHRSAAWARRHPAAVALMVPGIYVVGSALNVLGLLAQGRDPLLVGLWTLVGVGGVMMGAVRLRRVRASRSKQRPDPGDAGDAPDP